MDLGDTRCAICGIPLDEGVDTYRDTEAWVAYCPDHQPPGSGARETGLGIETGTARPAPWEQGSRLTRRDLRERASHPHRGPLLLKVPPESQSNISLSEDARGRQIIARRLEALKKYGVIALHGRQFPGSGANIDEIAIGPSGIFVIDVKRYEGIAVRKVFSGSVFNACPPRLSVGGLDRTKLVLDMASQMDVVRTALRGLPEARGAPGRPMLAFVGARWGPLRSPIDVDGVLVAWPKMVAKVVSQPGPLRLPVVERIADHLSQRLPPA